MLKYKIGWLLWGQNLSGNSCADYYCYYFFLEGMLSEKKKEKHKE